MQFQKDDDPFRHIGSIDIDLVIDFLKISKEQYAGIVELMETRGYKPRKDRMGRDIPFSFERTIQELKIAVDFLAGEYGGTHKTHRHQRVQSDLLARKARGADLLPEHHLLLQLNGRLPGGENQKSKVRMGDVVSILAMKGITISERYKEKDAYDIYALVAHYKEGALSCFEEIAHVCGKGLVREGMKSICEKFSTESSVGPVWAARFMEPDNPVAARMKQTEIFQKVSPFVEKIRKII
ncbi:MAG: hypothetical protein HY541_08240 [Deltaproteobacteria bacterium]|nr:hypothetical protein [Deltaproteobacteria bacterium]